MAGSNDNGKGEAKGKRKPLRWIVGCGTIALLLVVLAPFVLRAGLVEAYSIDGPSMAPGFPAGTRVAVNKTAYGLFLPFANHAATTWGTPHRGDVVILRTVREHIDVAKRILGIGGDSIAIDAGQVVLNHRPLGTVALGPARGANPGDQCFEEHLGKRHWKVIRAADPQPLHVGPIVVPKGQVYVLGDRRDRSNDSRFFGPVPVDHLKGRVSTIYLHGRGATCP